MTTIIEAIAAVTAAALREIGADVGSDEIVRLIQQPNKPGFGQFAVPIFQF